MRGFLKMTLGAIKSISIYPFCDLKLQRFFFLTHPSLRLMSLAFLCKINGTSKEHGGAKQNFWPGFLRRCNMQWSNKR